MMIGIGIPISQSSAPFPKPMSASCRFPTNLTCVYVQSSCKEEAPEGIRPSRAPKAAERLIAALDALGHAVSVNDGHATVTMLAVNHDVSLASVMMAPVA